MFVYLFISVYRQQGKSPPIGEVNRIQTRHNTKKASGVHLCYLSLHGSAFCYQVHRLLYRSQLSARAHSSGNEFEKYPSRFPLSLQPTPSLDAEIYNGLSLRKDLATCLAIDHRRNGMRSSTQFVHFVFSMGNMAHELV